MKESVLRFLTRAGCIATLLLLLAAFSFGQVTKGSISGTVVDPSDAVVANAQVKITEVSTGATFTTTAGPTGDFHFNLINPGTYKLEVKAQGFRTLVQTGLVVNSGVESGLGKVRMSIGGANEVVEVNEDAPLVDTTQSQVTSSFSTQTFAELPGMNNNGGMDQLALLVPGVSGDRDNGMSNTNGASFSSNGLRGRNNDQQIDGQNNNDNSVGGPGLFVTNSEFVAEYQIVTNNFGAEYGRNAGSVVNVITKSGTNNLHGSVYAMGTNSAFNALNYEDKVFDDYKKPPRMNDLFGGFTLGGPIKKDKLFYFGGFDMEGIAQNEIFSTGSKTPTPAGLATLNTCFPNSASVKALTNYGPYGIAAGNPRPTGTHSLIDIIDPNSEDPENPTILCGGVELAGVMRVVPSPFRQYDFINKVDYVGSKDTISARYMYNKSTYFNIDQGNASAGYFMDVPGLSQQARVNWAHTFSNTLSNEVSLTYGRNNAEFGGNEFGTVPTASLYDQGVSSVSVGSGNLGFGQSSSLPQQRFVNTWQVQDNLVWVRGRHTVKAGANLSYQRSLNRFLPNVNGTYSFSGWNSFVLNTPTSVSITVGNPNLDFREYDRFFYVKDEWKVTSNFTLNYGLTYTYYGQPANLFHKNDTKLQHGSNPLWNPTLDDSVTIYPQLPTQKALFAPSVGFSWSPFGDGKTVLRGGYRLSYDPPFYNIYLNMASSAPQVMSQTFRSSLGNAEPLSAVPTGPNARAAQAAYLTPGVFNPRTYTQTRLSPDFGADKVHSWSFGVQRELTKDLAFESRYVGNAGRNLFQSINGNPNVAALKAAFPALVPTNLTACSTNGRVICDYGLIRERTNTGYSDYHGWQNELRANNLFNQLLVRVGYTFSHTTDNVSEIFSTQGGGTTSAYAQNPFDYKKGEHGTSGLDFPHRFTATFSENLPFFKSQKGALGHVAGGWGISGTYTLASGQPYSPTQYCITSSICTYPGYSGFVPDASFTGSYAGFYDNLRPFMGNPDAPITAVGAYAGDVCGYWGGASCELAENTLISWNTANRTGDDPNGGYTTITPDQVRYIVNGKVSQGINGTPFGNVGRNSARDFWTNQANAMIFKNTKISERVSFQFDVNFINVFNHRNFSSVDPWIDDAGNGDQWNEFGDPKYTTARGRQIIFHAKIKF